MKKTITIIMLAIAMLAGGATVEAKTTKKTKAKTTQTSKKAGGFVSCLNPKSLKWGGDTDSYLQSKGFQAEGDDTWTFERGSKSCTVEQRATDFETEGAGMKFLVTITGDNSALNKFYNKAKKIRTATVVKDGNTVIITYVGE